MTELASIVLFAESPARTAAFFQALGVSLAAEEHGDEAVHLAGELAGVHLAVLPATAPGRDVSWRAAGNTFVGLWVESLDAARAAVADLGAEVNVEHERREWGCRAIVTDPDGRSIELNQGGHCAR